MHVVQNKAGAAYLTGASAKPEAAPDRSLSPRAWAGSLLLVISALWPPELHLRNGMPEWDHIVLGK